MSHRARVAALAAVACVLTGCASDAAAPAEEPVVVRAGDPTGDVRLTVSPGTAPDEPKYAQVDLTRVELQRRTRGLRLVFTLAGPVGVDGYRTEIRLFTDSGAKAQPFRRLALYAYLWPDGPYASVDSFEGRGDETRYLTCDAAVTVRDREVRIDVPERCVPKPFRGRIHAGAVLYTDSEDSETSLAQDELRSAGRPGIPAAP